MGRLARAEIYASEGLRDHKLGALLPFDCAPAEYFRTKLKEFDEDQAREARMRPFLGGRGRQPALRSSAHDVSDALVQLICRWMCPESLHVYRRIGTREHEGSVRKASSVDVDVILSVNAPKVSADAGFGELVSQLQGPRSAYAQREFEAVRAHALHTVAHPRATDRGPPPAIARAPPALPAATPQPHAAALAPGTHAFVPRDCWPGDPCAEHNGAGWTAYVQSVTKHTAVVTFPFTLSPSGEPFEPVRVPLRMLRALEQRSA
ncbi:hypothetical protein AB1Y20_007718 [Prymnesium parvum]|uniref:Polymerase nucleotidyl transferase domain-containing protein n=1 Tax=Prymnesium parvum TaxID=97485 RepID=A0AB34IZP9_PRYPA